MYNILITVNIIITALKYSFGHQSEQLSDVTWNTSGFLPSLVDLGAVREFQIM